MLSREDFAEFFEALHGPGVRPFAWQEKLLDHVVSTGRWPEQIAAPTGAGKSSVVEVHVFACALAALGAGARVPRRLAVVVNRRALTDAHADRAARLRDELAQAPDGDHGVLGRVRDALVSLRPPEALDRAPLVVTTMRGAAATDRAWLNAPEACAILCMTPAMWASSLLFRSYGASRFARPRLAGLLALDAAVVLDEAHLNRQVLVTARRVGQLSAGSADRLGLPGLQVVEMTATPSQTSAATIGVERGDLARDPRLAGRVQAAKSAVYAPTDHWPANRKMTAKYRDVVVNQVVSAVEDARELVPDAADGTHAPRTVGCVLNRIDSATQVVKKLRDKHGLECRLWVGRMRPWDLERLRREDPGLFDVSGSGRVDVLVATQTIEVGVDLDLAAMVTELASGSALAQRAGRVNRLGDRQRGSVVVVGPPPETELTKDALPYQAADLAEGRDWALARADDGDLSPLAVSEDPPSPEQPRRILWQRPEPWDAVLWAKTSMDLVIEPELDLWLRDDLEPEVGTVGVVLRDLAALPDATACETLLRAVPPQESEVFPAMITTARAVMGQLAKAADAPLEQAVLWQDGETLPLTHALAEDDVEIDVGQRMRPGDVLVLDASTPLLTEGVVTPDGTDPGIPVQVQDLEGITAIVTDPDELGRLSDMEIDELEREFPDQSLEWSPGWDPDAATPPAWLVVRSGEVVDDESDTRSAWSRSRRVLLADHNAAVSGRVEALASGLGLEPASVQALAEAGRWHDVGKADERFQVMLGRREGDEALAKSGGRLPRSVQRAWADAGLPPGWRHELASAAAYWEQAGREGTDAQERDLVTRLVGTSHGRGRPTFNHDPVTAGPACLEALGELVGEGEWESLIARTDRSFGPWGTAYVEALLRAADCTISAEGK